MIVAENLMSTDVLTVREDEKIAELLDVLVGEHLHGAPVLDQSGKLVGVVSQQDVFFSALTENGGAQPTTVREIMTSPAVSATRDTSVTALCRMMYKLRIHRVPIVDDGAVIGIVSSLDICSAVARGETLA